MPLMPVLPDGFWSGSGPWIGGFLLGFAGWVGRTAVRLMARMTQLEGATESLAEKLDRLHAANIARLDHIEEQQTHGANRHEVRAISQRLDAVDRTVIGMGEQVKAALQFAEETRQDVREIRTLVIGLAQRDKGTGDD